ncbi:16S rRNA methyltransferase [Defluviimonas sp. 20V17]|uniref:16S rRNA (Cytosine967-C5)-methyltransferase n=1 Tax=Allgaiera indica TaxID=765699 RepID=A0AAN4URU9_9RHOB|nr:RsmB/NOP family class I SAM-dependent RNA methyltransferase [Allgaiera indica]KDB02608.1 16S rRNA methyltransferase [Defluviimonas sp. 20V17]GHE01680.1 16S rRNA methyltransferase [Allgaiera indica]SDW96314.1 16S rRNA (cytosine967-C5)-methyltransferase [Allgaiera indica]
MATGQEVRQAAWSVLGAVLQEHRLLAEVLADSAGALAPLSPPERARAQRLALATLRQMQRADRLLGPHLRRMPPAPVMNALRLALVEIHAEGAPAHGAVNAAVTLLRRDKATGRYAGLANAVLRKAGQAPGWDTLPPQSLPGWLRKPLITAWGKASVTAIEAIQAAAPPLDLTPKDPAQAAALAEALGAEALPTGSLRLSAPGQVSALTGYSEGAWWVQDAAAALPALLLAPQPGEHVADLCAAPGGKTLQLAAAGARVEAVDISAARMARVTENLARCGLTARTHVADALSWQPQAPLDAVLLDAPCSATGTIRRHPDLPFVKDGTELDTLVALQARLIDRALTLLRPGGRLVFCTCSLLPEEGEAQITAALARHPGLAVLPAEAPGIAPDWRSSEGGLRIRPDHWADRGGIDGFYMAVLARAAPVP